MDYSLIVAWVCFVVGYLSIVVPLIGGTANGICSSYGNDFLMGVTIHLALVGVVVVAAGVIAFVWSFFYLIEVYF